MDSRDLRWLLDVVDSGSFTEAARRRAVAVSTVTRRIDALEALLQTRLIDRAQPGARLTAAGERIATLARAQIEGAERIMLAATAARLPAVRETVTVSATEFVIAERLAPALGRLFATSPSVSVDLQSQAHLISLSARDADLAIRMSRPEGNSLLIRKIGQIDLGLFASAAYLAGRAVSAIDLSQERLLTYDDSYGRMPEYLWAGQVGLARAVVLRTGSTRGLLNAAIAGLGIAILPRRDAVAVGLVEMPSPLALEPRSAWLVVHRDLRQVPAIAATYDWIVASFAGDRRSGA